MAMDAHQKGSCRPSCAGSRARFQFCRIGSNSAAQHARRNRSEEHTSELQSRLHLVCRLLLEKKNTDELTRREEPLRKLAEAQGKIETRATDRYKCEQSQHEARSARRSAKATGMGKDAAGCEP